MNPETKTCQNCKQNFVIEPEDFQFYEKIQVPPPTWCPGCRAIRRLSFWNEHNLYRATHHKTGKEIFSAYPKTSGAKLYDHDYWWSDGWDASEYARDYDFSKTFFEQFRELFYAVPWAALSIWHLNNSDYCNNGNRLKDCYLCFDADESENCFYGVGFRHCSNSFDFSEANYLESCYGLLSCDRCNQTFMSVESDDCQNVWFSRECYNCQNCFGCVNLRHKQYHIFNVPYTKEEYLEKIKEFNLGSYRALEAIQKQIYPFWLKHPFKYIHGHHNENVIGDYVYHAKNAKYCYQVIKDIKDLKYCERVVNGAADCYDYTHWGDNSELMYESIICGENCRQVKFSFECWPACEEVEYSAHCHSSTHLFGCVGLKKKSYCIFNKQYSREDFHKLREKIITHMNEKPFTDHRGRIYRYGEFFPLEISPFAYNETIAQDLFLLTKDAATQKGFRWRDPEAKEFKVTLGASDLPDHIRDVPEDILKETIGCLGCKKAYRILASELEFYKKFEISLPRLCHACRHQARIKLRNSPKWYLRQCMCDYQKYSNTIPHRHHETGPCSNQFHTTYALNRPEIVYCESCYNLEVN
ncbi:MAG: hypothetical protein HY093_00705 [Candidatus Liptonbacteria bacterium]|nr:hypothetical protein [Candidatus Liptonbacteria bacterium]